MNEEYGKIIGITHSIKRKARSLFSEVPLLGWLFGMLIAVILERYVGEALAESLGLSKIPMLFGVVMMLKNPLMIPSTVLYLFTIFVLPISVVARLISGAANRVAAKLLDLPILISVIIHIGLLYAVLYLWSEASAYRVLTLKLTLIAVILTLSLNVVNGYMG